MQQLESRSACHKTHLRAYTNLQHRYIHISAVNLNVPTRWTRGWLVWLPQASKPRQSMVCCVPLDELSPLRMVLVPALLSCVCLQHFLEIVLVFSLFFPNLKGGPKHEIEVTYLAYIVFLNVSRQGESSGATYLDPSPLYTELAFLAPPERGGPPHLKSTQFTKKIFWQRKWTAQTECFPMVYGFDMFTRL